MKSARLAMMATTWIRSQGPLASGSPDGSNLYAGGARIAEWKEGVLAIVPQKGSPVEEMHKDALVDFILRKIQREEILWELVRPATRNNARGVSCSV